MPSPSAVSEAGQETAEKLLQGADPSSIPQHQLLAAIDALAHRKSPEAADALARIEAPKEAAKAARRALFRLQSGGIRPTHEAPPAEAAAAEPRGAAAAGIKLLEGQVSSYDPRGTRAVSILAEKPFTGLVSLFAIASDTDGLLDAELIGTTKKAFHTRLDNFSKQFTYVEFVPTPADYANQMVHRCSELNEKSGHPVPQDFAMWRSLGAEAPEQLIEPPIMSELAVDDVRSKVQLADTAELADTEFEAWRFDQDALKEHLTRLDTARGGPLVVSEDAQRQRESAIVDEAADALFDDAALARARERLQETAHLVLQQGKRDLAERCLRAALGIGEGSPHEHPFLRAIVAASLREAQGEQASQEAPDEHQHSHGPTRTESGIILPG
ncbi:MAG: hypothetical protein JO247_03105 [Chloroflexi bacterium]|nr:hypothetical protein [Chloroflexota bacterium]